jgi:hypothetical protein
MKNLKTKLSYLFYILLTAVFLTACTYKLEGKIVQDMDGKIYKLKGSQKTSESYLLIEIDTTNYLDKFKNNR